MRRPRTAEDDLAEVEVVEDGSGEDGHADDESRPSPHGVPPSAHAGPDSAGRHSAGHDSARRRRARRSVGAAVGLLGALVLTATGLEVADERARRAVLADVPGLVASELDLARPLEERWAQESAVLWVVPVADGLVVYGVDDVLAGLSRTGEPVWEVPLGGDGRGWCVPVAAREALGGVPGGLALPALTGTPVTTVVCQHDDGFRSFAVADGTEIGHLPLDGTERQVAQVERDFVVVATRAVGRHVVTRWSPVTGEAVWEAPAPAPRRGLPWSAWDVAAGEDVVHVRGEDLTALDARTGDVLPPGSQDVMDAVERARLEGRVERVLVLADGTQVLLRLDEVEQTVLRLPDGTTRTLTGRVLVPAMSDRRGSALLLVTTPDGALRAYDAGSGTQRWEVAGVRARAVLLDLEGRVVVLGESGVTALDGESGARLWTGGSPAADVAAGPVTDGDVVLLPETAADGAADLVARRLEDGTELWRAPLPAGVAEVGAVDDVVVVRSQDGLVGLG